jgi:Na+/melibiose symporter-like transporter
MNKGTAIALLVVGVILLIFGFDANHSASSGISQVATGTPSAKAIWLLIGGAVAAIVGGVSLAAK